MVHQKQMHLVTIDRQSHPVIVIKCRNLRDELWEDRPVAYDSGANSNSNQFAPFGNLRRVLHHRTRVPTRRGKSTEERSPPKKSGVMHMWRNVRQIVIEIE